MNGNTTSLNKRNTAFVAASIAIIILLFLAGALAQKEKMEWLYDFKLKQQAEQLITNKDYRQAKVNLELLLAKDRHARNPSVLQDYALCVNVLGDSAKALEYYDRAREVSPLLVTNSLFLAKYAETLYKLGKLQEARKYLEISMIINTNKELAPLLIDLKATLDKQLGS